MGNLLLLIFHTDTHYSAFVKQNQPLFEKNFTRGKWLLPDLARLSSLFFCTKKRTLAKSTPNFKKFSCFFHVPKPDSLWTHRSPVCFDSVCQVRIFAQKICHSKKHHLTKSGENRDPTPLILCEPKLNIHRIPHLWITLVEKSVENVENYELSTVIPILSKIPTACGKTAYRFA